ncbi:MAG: hypothetical protein ACRDTA_30205 [Pseudonocardiaceae bacterium]
MDHIPPDRQITGEPSRTADVLPTAVPPATRGVEIVETSPAEPPLTPGEALVKLFLDNADRGCNAENDVFVEELLTRRRAVQAFANPSER